MKGYVQVYTGNGKGKTTAATGLAVRAVGAGLNVFIGQFIKGSDSAEMTLLRERCPEVTIEQFGYGRFIKKRPTENDIAIAKHGMERLMEVATSDKYDVVIADEANGAVNAGIITVENLIELIDTKHNNVELIITGRNADKKIIARADLVTEMNVIKHYFNAGVSARKGIEF